MINVTKTYLPSLEDYNQYLERIWKNSWVTNNGELVRELEQKLKDYFNVKHLFFVSNGTIALQIAIKALDLKGEIITTPFSYVATTGSILWENLTPRFADINKENFTIDPQSIKDLINKTTTAIIPTHVYGLPCKTEEIDKIAHENGLKVIYDGAHCFGAKYKNKSLLTYGDISTISFHATKLFHTIEGGAIATEDDNLAEKIDLYRRFGHTGDEHYTIGINGKNSEVHAAMGLANYSMINEFISRRKELVEYYESKIKTMDMTRPQIHNREEYNYAYFPVVLNSEDQVINVINTLKKNDIFVRRYFYPSLNKLPYLETRDNCPVAEDVASRVICLPLFYEMQEDQIDLIVAKLKEALK